MRHPSIFKFLSWAGPALVAVLWALPIGISQMGQTYPRLAEWGERIFNKWWPLVTAPFFLVAMIILAILYIVSLVYCGSAPAKLDAAKISQQEHRVRILQTLRANVVTNAKHDQKHIKLYLESHALYPAVRKYLSSEFRDRLEASGGTSWAIDSNSNLNPLEVAFLDELDRIETEWGLD